MSEDKAIFIVNQMSKIEMLKVYMIYFVSQIYLKHTLNYYKSGYGRLNCVSFEMFCNEKNIITHNVTNWEEKGFAQNKWTVFAPNSIYNYIQKNIK